MKNSPTSQASVSKKGHSIPGYWNNGGDRSGGRSQVQLGVLPVGSLKADCWGREEHQVTVSELRDPWEALLDMLSLMNEFKNYLFCAGFKILPRSLHVPRLSHNKRRVSLPSCGARDALHVSVPLKSTMRKHLKRRHKTV